MSIAFEYYEFFKRLVVLRFFRFEKQATTNQNSNVSTTCIHVSYTKIVLGSDPQTIDAIVCEYIHSFLFLLLLLLLLFLWMFWVGWLFGISCRDVNVEKYRVNTYIHMCISI